MVRKVAEFIVDKRKLFLLIFICLIVYAVVSIPKTVVNYDISSYLPDSTDTKKAIDIMTNEFTTYGSSQILVRNVTYEKASELADKLGEIEGVRSVTFSDSEDNYKESAAYMTVTMRAVSGTEEVTETVAKMRQALDGFDYRMISGDTSGTDEMLAREMTIILILAAVVIAVVLFLTSKSYMEILVFPIVFGVSALLNMGTNYWLSSISFVTNSIAVVLQLALAVDYAIIFCHRFTDELDKHDAREACIIALSKAVPEISASSLTTVSGLIALMFMQLRLGFDIGIVMTKGIILSMLTVFLLMPALLMVFAGGIKKTVHRSFLPKAKMLGVVAVKLRRILPIFFVIIVGFCTYMQGQSVYAYSYNAIDTDRPTEDKVTLDEIQDIFGKNTMMAVLVPTGDYKSEAKVIKMLEEKELVTSVLGLASVEISDDYRLCDAVTYRQFADVVGLGNDTARLAYLAYGISNGDYGVINYIDDYQIPIIDLFNYIIEERDSGIIKIEGATGEKLDDLNEELQFAQSQLVGKNYSRIVFTADCDQESPEAYALIDEVRAEILTVYDEAILVGDSTSSYDLSSSFSSDNTLISLMTIVFIAVILLFTFKSAGIPVLLLLVIQGSVWINFAVPPIMNKRIFFFAYLVVSAIQMGATIDYAIVITSRFNELKARMDKKSAAMLSVSQCFPTVFTSGTIMTVAGLLIGMISTDPIISGIGTTLGRGTIISIMSVLFVLPELLVIFDKLIQKSSFEIEIALPTDDVMVNSRVNGRIRGYINGYIDADMKGWIRGDMRANLEQLEQADVKNVAIKEKDEQEVADGSENEYELTVKEMNERRKKRRNDETNESKASGENAQEEEDKNGGKADERKD